MRRSYWLSGLFGLCVGVAGAQPQPPAPSSAPNPIPPSTSPPAQVAPWANKFFLPDIATNREQTPPPAITHNFGDVPHGTLCVHKFPITNIYDVPMQITEVRMSCLCLDYVRMTKVLQPNETAEFVVTMNTGKFVGFNAQTFYVTFGPKYVSTAVIRVQANSRTEVAVNPGAIAFGTVAQGTKASQSVTVRYSGKAKDWKLTEVVAPAGLDVQMTETGRGGPLGGGAEYRVDVNLKPNAPPGPIAEQITLKTNDPANPLVQVQVSGTVAAPIELAPNRVVLGTIPLGKSGSQRVLIRASKPFRVLGVDGAGAGLSVELPPSSAALPVQVVTVKYEPTQIGLVTRELHIRTDLEGGATAVLPVEVEGVK
ncbi:MAG TPA: DUF1573 domain-containing protein [Gemmataceae bacterium]|nr:DUF1573 domain-containing protein [Gemmataceae bacterium]